jgi:hypothetical protein
VPEDYTDIIMFNKMNGNVSHHRLIQLREVNMIFESSIRVSDVLNLLKRGIKQYISLAKVWRQR